MQLFLRILKAFASTVKQLEKKKKLELEAIWSEVILLEVAAAYKKDIQITLVDHLK